MKTFKRRALSISLMVVFAVALGSVAGYSQAKAQPTPATMEATEATAAQPSMEPAPDPMAAGTNPVAVEKKPEPAKVEKAAKNEDPVWKVIVGGLLQIILLFVGTIATACGPFLIKWISKKAKIEDKQMIAMFDALYDSAISVGIHFATQQSNKLNNNPEAKAKRIKWATDKAKEMIQEYGLPEKTAEWIEDRIEARLGELNGKKEVKDTSEEKELEEASEEK